MEETEFVPCQILAARCTYNSTGVDHATRIGSTAGDEMCNLYIMFFTEPGRVADYLMCFDEQEGEAVTRGLPRDSDTPPAARPALEAHAANSAAGAGPSEISYAQMFEEEQRNSSSKKKGGLGENGVYRVAQLNLTMPGRPRLQKLTFGKSSLFSALCCVCSARVFHHVLHAVPRRAAEPGGRLHLHRDPRLGPRHHRHLGHRLQCHRGRQQGAPHDRQQVSSRTGQDFITVIFPRCKSPVKASVGSTWDCRHHAMCKDSSKIMFAWAKHAEPTKLPGEVGFQLEKTDWLVLQVSIDAVLSSFSLPQY